jgi:hypothetical protein
VIWRAIIGWLTGGGLNGLAAQLRKAHEAKLAAQTQSEVLAAEHDMARLENAYRLASLANDDRWSATSLGRYLVVVPFGVWWAATYIDSTFSFAWATLEPPRYLVDMAEWLVPAIIVGDVGKSVARRFR